MTAVDWQEASSEVRACDLCAYDRHRGQVLITLCPAHDVIHAPSWPVRPYPAPQPSPTFAGERMPLAAHPPAIVARIDRHLAEQCGCQQVTCWRCSGGAR